MLRWEWKKDERVMNEMNDGEMEKDEDCLEGGAVLRRVLFVGWNYVCTVGL